MAKRFEIARVGGIHGESLNEQRPAETAGKGAKEMRITCPNCRAQYDVDPAMIPEAGRDVQCSSCAHTWFQTRADDASMETEAGAQVAAEDTADEEVSDGVGEEDTPLPEEIEAEAATAAAGDEAQTWDEAAPEPDAGDGEPRGDEPGAEAPEDVLETRASGSEAAEEIPSDDTATGPADDVEEAAAAAKVTPDDDTGEMPEDLDDRLRAAMERPREDMVEDEVLESEAFRATMREAVSDPTAVTEAEGQVSAPEEEADTETSTEPGPALDREVADILREEAEFEATRRRSEDAPPAFDPQGDLAFGEGGASPVLRERLDRMRSDGVPEPTIAASAASATGAELAGARRDRLPDIEEINSTLRPGQGAPEPEIPMSAAEIATTRRSGFRSGFVTIIIVTALLIGAYVYAPQIIRAIPATEGAMISYVDIANSARDRIDGMMARAISGINTMVGEGSNGA